MLTFRLTIVIITVIELALAFTNLNVAVIFPVALGALPSPSVPPHAVAVGER
jgi:hypothetical protein